MESIENKHYLYKEYKDKVINVYKDERLEYYYHPKIQEFLQSICSHYEKVINVGENKQRNGIHAKARSAYADNGGLQDLIIVPNSYSYENPTKPYVTVEVKIPDIDIEIEKDTITRYNKLKVENHIGQLNEQFKKTSYIIFTDCITWYLLIAHGNSISTKEELSLVELSQEEWIWKREIYKFSGEDKEFFKKIGFDYVGEHEIENEPIDWKELIEKLTEFLEKSKKNY
ncbi:hypothetical protein [Clostridium sp. FP1]|uniref:hypothetical protein n=1 Tax=Clostridium sp. FP1 TaxID=2724076 RepID=UPI0013E924FB|nr:hypothetical protein [Clostridium sp. FP1]MBZ9634623.1 hypothetical protein [Clostridium sp. FP1]